MSDDYIPFDDKKPNNYFTFKPKKFILVKNYKTLKDELIDLYEKLKPTETERTIRKWIINKFNEVLGNIEEYGSFYTDTFLPSSDMDIVIMKDGKDILCEAYEKLINSEIINSIIYLKHTKVPILRCTDSYFGFRIDIISKENACIKQNIFAKKILDQNLGLKMFCFILKKFLKIRDLNDSRRGGLCSYAQFLLCYHFFQMHPLLQSKSIDPIENIDILFMDFFQFYGIVFNYSQINIKNSLYSLNNTDHMLSIIDINNNDAGDKCSNMKAIKEVFSHAYNIMKLVMSKCDHSLLQLWIPNIEHDLKFRESILKKSKAIIKNN